MRKEQSVALEHPVVFISYSHDSDNHKARVLELSEKLTREGCICRLDACKNTDEDWPTWMTRELRVSHFILCVVTNSYLTRFYNEGPADIGHGVAWEATMIRRMLMRTKLLNSRIFPVFFEKEDLKSIPLELDGYDRFYLSDPTGVPSLLNKLLASPRRSFAEVINDVNVMSPPVASLTIPPNDLRIEPHRKEVTVAEAETPFANKRRDSRLIIAMSVGLLLLVAVPIAKVAWTEGTEDTNRRPEETGGNVRASNSQHRLAQVPIVKGGVIDQMEPLSIADARAGYRVRVANKDNADCIQIGHPNRTDVSNATIPHGERGTVLEVSPGRSLCEVRWDDKKLPNGWIPFDSLQLEPNQDIRESTK